MSNQHSDGFPRIRFGCSATAVVVVGFLVGALLATSVVVGATAAGAIVPGPAGRIAFESNRTGDNEIFTMNPDGSVQRNVTNHPANDVFPAWSPEASRITFASDRHEESNLDVYVMNADGSGVTQLTNSPGEDRGTSWTSDGQRIVFHSSRDRDATHTFDIFTMNADGSNETKIFTNGAVPYVCGDSTNGIIVFNSIGDPLGTNPTNPGGTRDFEIFTMNMTGGNVFQVTNNTVLDSGPKLSPDCSTISYNSQDTTSLDVHRINLDGTGDVNLTNTPGVFDAFSAFSPAGDEIVFSTNRDVNFEIYKMSAVDGSNVTRLTFTELGQANLRSDWGTAAIQVFPGAHMTLAKFASPTEGDAPLPVTYTYRLANEGTDPIFHTTVTDDSCGPVVLQSGDVNANQLLDPGEVWMLTCSQTLTGTNTNTAAASGTSTLTGLPVTSNSFRVTVTVNPLAPPGEGLLLTKSASPTSGTSPLPVTYTYTLDNTGPHPLFHTTVTDDGCVPVTLLAGDSDNDQLLDPGETWTLTCSQTLTGTNTNTAVAGATSTGSGLAVTSNTVAVTVTVTAANPPGEGMTLAKSASPTSGQAPLPVTYTYTLSSLGPHPLFHTTVTDDSCGPVTLNAGDSDNDNLLDPGETWTLTCSQTLTATNTNTAVAGATSTGTGLAVTSNSVQATVTVTPGT